MVPAEQVAPIKVDADDDDLLQLVPCLLLSDVAEYVNARLGDEGFFWQKNELKHQYSTYSIIYLASLYTEIYSTIYAYERKPSTKSSRDRINNSKPT